MDDQTSLARLVFPRREGIDPRIAKPFDKRGG
jgi:hypothetical protein